MFFNQILSIRNGSAPFDWPRDSNLTNLGCSASGLFSFVVHGFIDSKGAWRIDLARKFLKHRGGCVIVVDWGKYSDFTEYFYLVLTHFKNVSNTILKRLKILETEGVLPDNILLYGHSLGARLVVRAGIDFGKNKIGLIDGWY